MSATSDATSDATSAIWTRFVQMAEINDRGLLARNARWESHSQCFYGLIILRHTSHYNLNLMKLFRSVSQQAALPPIFGYQASLRPPNGYSSFNCALIDCHTHR